MLMGECQKSKKNSTQNNDTLVRQSKPTMQIQVLMFAAAREAAQSDSLGIEVSDDACAKDVLNSIAVALPSISALMPSCRLAIDGQYVSPDTVIDANRELALIPPVSGG